jgi:hypothetical protein
MRESEAQTIAKGIAVDNPIELRLRYRFDFSVHILDLSRLRETGTGRIVGSSTSMEEWAGGTVMGGRFRLDARRSVRFVLGRLLAGLIAAGWLTGSFAVAVERAPLQVRERVGTARVGEYVRAGVPLPRSWSVTDPSALRLTDDAGTPLPAQFEVLARWGGPPDDPAAPIRWVLVGWRESLAGGAVRDLYLDAGGPGPEPPTAVQVAQTPDGVTVDTGGAVFEIRTDDFNLLHQVRIGAEDLLQPLDGRTAIHYEPAGTLSIVPGGSPDLTPRTTAIQVERAGPLCAEVRVTGSVRDAADRPVLDFTARLGFTAGTADVDIDFTVENNHPLIERPEDGQPANAHDLGAVNSVYVGSLGLAVRLRDTGAPLQVFTEGGAAVSAPTGPVRLFQDSSGTAYWNAYVGLVGWPGYEQTATPRLQAYCATPGYTVTGAGSPVSGAQALGWLAAGRAGGPQVLAAVRDFWQNFPKALAASPDGTVAADLFPEGGRYFHNLRTGEEKTHRILFAFGLGAPVAGTAEARARAFQSPLAAAADPAWVHRCRVVEDLPPVDLAAWPLYERYVRVAFEPNPDFDPEVDDPSFGNRTLEQIIGEYNFYGWQDFGDVPLDYEAFGPNQAGQMNLKYWFTEAMFLQFCRSGDFRWLDLALPAARHISDEDYLHIPDGGAYHWAHGAYFGHSAHDEPGCTNPNRNYNSPSVDLFFGGPDLALAWCLTGERRFREVMAEGLVSMLAMSAFSDFTYPIPWRERANLITGYLEGYRLTGEAVWLQEARTIVGYSADLSTKTWLADPAGFGAAHPGEFLSSFQFAQMLWAMGRYLDVCREYGLPDDLGVAGALAAYGDFILDRLAVEYRSGRSAIPHEYYFDGSDPSYLDVNNWMLTVADALAYAYKYTGRSHFLEGGAPFYACGTTDVVWEDDPPVYLATKDLVNSCRWGMVYMSQWAGLGQREGDLNEDEAVDVVDLAILQHWLAGHVEAGMPPFRAPLAAAQLNGDETVDARDLLLLARRLAE